MAFNVPKFKNNTIGWCHKGLYSSKRPNVVVGGVQYRLCIVE